MYLYVYKMASNLILNPWLAWADPARGLWRDQPPWNGSVPPSPGNNRKNKKNKKTWIELVTFVKTDTNG